MYKPNDKVRCAEASTPLFTVGKDCLILPNGGIIANDGGVFFANEGCATGADWLEMKGWYKFELVTEPKFKVGDKIRFVNANMLRDGQTAKVTVFDKNDQPYCCKFSDGALIWLRESEMQSITPSISIYQDGAKSNISYTQEHGKRHAGIASTGDFEADARTLLEAVTLSMPAKEPITLWCKKDFSCDHQLTKGKLYTYTPNQFFPYDNENGTGMCETWDDYKKNNSEYTDNLVECVKRPAEVGEWVVIADAQPKGAQDYKNGDVLRVARLGHWNGFVYADKYQIDCLSPKEYLVLKDYKPLYNGKVFCSDGVGKRGWSGGIIYTFIDGCCRDDDGEKQPTTRKHCSSFADVQMVLGKGFHEVKGEA